MDDRRLSMNPDKDMEWIYDPQYANDERAKHLREARARAIASAPEWMKRHAQLNDAMREAAAAHPNLTAATVEVPKREPDYMAPAEEWSDYEEGRADGFNAALDAIK